MRAKQVPTSYTMPALSHGSEGQVQRIIRDVEDPETGRPRIVMQNVRPGSLGALHANGSITDEQMAAGFRFEQLYERAHSDGMRAIDYSRVRVDCGSTVRDLVPDSAVRAKRELEKIESHLRHGYKYLKGFVIDGKTLKVMGEEYAAAKGGSARTGAGYVSCRFNEALEDLDAYWNTSVGRGSGIRADIGEKTLIQVKLYEMADRFSSMTNQQQLAQLNALSAHIEKQCANENRS